MSLRFFVTRKRPSSDRSVSSASSSIVALSRPCFRPAPSSALPASSSKSWWRADDADVVEAVVGADRVRRVDRVAAHAARLAVEEHPALLRRVGRDRLRRRRRGSGRTASRGRRACARRRRSRGRRRRSSARGRRPPGTASGTRRRRRSLRDRGVAVRHAHLDRVQDRQLRLLLERRRAAVPERASGRRARSASSARCAGRAGRRCPPRPGRWSVKPRLTSWQVAHATVPSADSRVSK